MQIVASTPPLVASVFLDVRARIAFIPALFKALANDPRALEHAWLQARALRDDPRSNASAARLLELARPRLPYRPSRQVRFAVAPFLEELPLMLLTVTSLGLTLDGAFPLRPRPRVILPAPGPLPESPVPEYRGEHPLYAEIRGVYGTAHVPSMYRALAAQGLLEEPWRAIGPFLTTPSGLARVAQLGEAAEEEARRFPEVAFLREESARPILGEFRRALPRNLVFAGAASSRPASA